MKGKAMKKFWKRKPKHEHTADTLVYGPESNVGGFICRCGVAATIPGMPLPETYLKTLYSLDPSDASKRAVWKAFAQPVRTEVR
jgi:hypothetical protein